MRLCVRTCVYLIVISATMLSRTASAVNEELFPVVPSAATTTLPVTEVGEITTSLRRCRNVGEKSRGWGLHCVAASPPLNRASMGVDRRGTAHLGESHAVDLSKLHRWRGKTWRCLKDDETPRFLRREDGQSCWLIPRGNDPVGDLCARRCCAGRFTIQKTTLQSYEAKLRALIATQKYSCARTSVLRRSAVASSTTSETAEKSPKLR